MNIAINRLDPNLPDPVESRRRAAGRMVRIAYTTVVFGVLVFIVIYFGRPLVYLAGSGVVSSPVVYVSLPYTVQVTKMNVLRGMRVKAGQAIGEVWSPQLDDTVATYMRALAEVNVRSAELRVKVKAGRDSLDAAHSYLGVTEEATNHLDTSTTASLTFRIEMLRERALAQKTVAAQEAEVKEASAQLAMLDNFGQQIRNHMDHMERNFAGGRLFSPIDGIVTTPPAKDGTSVVAGTPLVEIQDPSKTFVYWYIPNNRLRDPEVGEQVVMLFGNWRLHGTITQLLPISEMFPAAKNREQIATQLARIDFKSSAAAPALNSQVTVHMFYTSFAARLSDVLNGLFGLDRG